MENELQRGATNELPQGECDTCGKEGPLLSGCSCGGFVPLFACLADEDDGEDTNVEDSHAR